jgi:hypothetical protein
MTFRLSHATPWILLGVTLATRAQTFGNPLLGFDEQVCASFGSSSHGLPLLAPAVRAAPRRTTNAMVYEAAPGRCADRDTAAAGKPAPGEGRGE